MSKREAFVTLPEDMADVVVGYLRTRAAQLRTRATIAANGGELDEHLALRNLSNSLKVVEALMLTDRHRTELLQKEIPTKLDGNAVSIIKSLDDNV